MFTIRPVFQPLGSSLCGQACVAALADIPLSASVTVFGTKGATTTRQVVSALRDLGFVCEDKLVRKTDAKPLPPLCMCVLHFDNVPGGHWVVWNDGAFIDPACGMYADLSPGCRITSFLPIRLAEDGRGPFRAHTEGA